MKKSEINIPADNAETTRKRAVINLSGAAFGSVVTIANEILAARFLGVSSYGLFAIGMLLVKMSELISNFGMPVTIMHLIPLYRERGERFKIVDTVIAVLTLSLIIAVVLAITLWILAPLIAGNLFNKPAATDYVRLLVLVIPLLSLTEIIGQITRAYGHAHYYVLIRNVMAPVCYGILLLALIGCASPGIHITLAYVSAYFIALIFAFRFLYGVVGENLDAYKTSFQWGEIYRYSWPVFINILLYMVFRWTDIFMVGIYLDVDDIGRYRGCLQVVVIFELVSMSIGAAVAHQYSVLERSGNLTQAQEIFMDNVRWITLLVAPLAVLISVNSSDILGLLGNDFVQARDVLTILTLAYTAKAIGLSLGLVLVITGRQGIETRIAAIVVVVNLILNFVLVPVMGAPGAATATLLASILFTLLRVFEVNRNLNLRYPTFKVASLLLMAFGLGAIIYYIMPLLFGIGALVQLLLLILALTAMTWRYSLTLEERVWIGTIIRGQRS